MASAFSSDALSPGFEAQRRRNQAGPPWSQILLVEDNTNRAERRSVPGNADTAGGRVAVRLHRICEGAPELVGATSFRLGALGTVQGRAPLALQLLDGLGQSLEGAVVVAGTTYGCNHHFLSGLCERGLPFVVELPPSELVKPADAPAPWACSGNPTALCEVLPFAAWTKVAATHPTSNLPIDLLWADFGSVFWSDLCVRLLVIQTGDVRRLQRGTIFALARVGDASPEQVIRAIGWARWIRPFMRRQERTARAVGVRPAVSDSAEVGPGLKGDLRLRVNIATARQQDEAAARHQSDLPLFSASPRQSGALGADPRVAEIFAGAGGMGLGFLLARQSERRYRLVFSGEVHPVYVETLRHNHSVLARGLRGGRVSPVPARVEPIDLREPKSARRVEDECRAAGGIDILIGGPPCQGFSSANRNSGHSTNPHNQLVDVFLTYVEKLRPRFFLMENVQGIVWTPKDSRGRNQLSVADYFLRRMEMAGYLVFPKLLDAVWYGVPQHRNRFFLLGMSSDLGYTADDFGHWGPFPHPTHGPGAKWPYVTVGDALWDLPAIGNGHDAAEMGYCPPGTDVLAQNRFLRSMRAGAPKAVIWDHVTSLHAAYVIERYKRIPAGGNWQNIADMLGSYADIDRTHSNIYRRLVWDEPAITIGHYRKSMLVHPLQDRGLSLREACRLQSFPDWFRFMGSIDGGERGLTHKQQQLANAVCPLVTKAIAEFILRL